MKVKADIKEALHRHRNSKKAETSKRFFKYRSNDIFLGVPKAIIRKLSKQYCALPLQDILPFMQSSVCEEQSLANALLCVKFHKASEKEQKAIFQFYIKHRYTIRDWDGVDDSAPYIVGKYLLERDKTILYKLAKSKHIWSRRIAIVATWWFIRNGHLDDTVYLAEILLNDKEDLIHKATGWMLRELGKRDERRLKAFLNKHYKVMPRTMLRYSIEKMTAKDKATYMKK